MKNFSSFSMAAVCLAGVLLSAVADEKKATLTADRVNVRGEATLNSEVITQLREGETVTVLEEITVEKPGPGQPAKWARILLPSNTPVWVYAPFIDPATKTVTASRLNVRGGPGENFSVVARLNQGDAVREIRTVDAWMEIEPPAGTHAFVAAEFLKMETPMLAANTPDRPAEPVTPPAPETPRPKEMPTPKPPEPIVTVETVTPAPPPAVATDMRANRKTPPPAVVPVPEPIVALPPTQVAPPETTPPPPPPRTIQPRPVRTPEPVKPELPKVPEPVVAPPPPEKPASTEPPPKRIVEREGIVKRAWSIQAPSGFVLEDPVTGQTVNYLYTGETGLQLKYYVGKHIRVTGPEALDSRWKTPLLEVQTLQSFP